MGRIPSLERFQRDPYGISRFIVFVHSVAEIVTFEIRPQTLDWVQFGAVRRKEQQAYVVRDLKCFRKMPTGSVHH
jgi:hypothetical protein